MYYKTPFFTFPGRLLFESYILDFVLAFTFFTSVCYAVLGKRFDHQRSAVGMSASIGAALSVGLVWWENRRGLSIRDLGPVAAVFAMVIIAIVIYKAIKHAAGSWAGGGLALGLFIMFAMIMGLDVPVDSDLIYGLMVIALVVGLLAILLHSHAGSHNYPFLHSIQPQISEIKDDQAQIYRNRSLSKKLFRGLRNLRKDSDLVKKRPEHINNTVAQIRRMLPAEGWLTERMAHLRKKDHAMKNGHIARMDELKRRTRNLPTPLKQQISAEIISRYKTLIDYDKRIERLDAMAAQNERRIRELTQRAEQCALSYDYKGLTDILEQAEKLQSHNSKIFKIIDRTEEKLTAIAKKVINETKRGDNNEQTQS